MKNPKLIFHTLNGVLTLGLLILLFRSMHWLSLPFAFHIYQVIFLIAIIQGVKYFLEIKFNERDPFKYNVVTKVFYFIGIGILTFAVLLKVMHWPGGSFLLLIAIFIQFVTYILSLTLNDDSIKEGTNPEILDDI